MNTEYEDWTPIEMKEVPQKKLVFEFTMGDWIFVFCWFGGILGVIAGTIWGLGGFAVIYFALLVGRIFAERTL